MHAWPCPVDAVCFRLVLLLCSDSDRVMLIYGLAVMDFVVRI